MVEQVDNNDIVDAGNTIADILTLINDNVVEQNERISSNASMISGICRQMDELKEARPNLTVVIREAIHEAVVEELDGRDILSKDELLHWHRSDDFIDGVVEVINDYDMDEKFNDALRWPTRMTSRTCTPWKDLQTLSMRCCLTASSRRQRPVTQTCTTYT